MNEESKSSGLGISAVLQIVFLVLKLTGLIDWSWWLIMLPIYVPIMLVVIISAISKYNGE